MKRIALLTNELPHAGGPTGGLGTFVVRMATALSEYGAEPEIFVVEEKSPGPRDLSGIRVESVPPARDWWLRGLSRVTRRWLRGPWGGPYAYVAGALALRRAVERRHRVAPFDIVHSTNCGATGLLVKGAPGRIHLLRLSSDRANWFEHDGRGKTRGERVMAYLEALSARRADAAYAPSRFLATSCARNWNTRVHVVRPPCVFDAAVNGSSNVPESEPAYLVHFGQLAPRKGTDLVARALVQAWEDAPAIRMVWAGAFRDPRDLERYRSWWGARSEQVAVLGRLGKAELYEVLQRALAAVLPSRVDNLPNTVIESLMFSVPVIGTDGASIDELVEPGRNGWLVPPEDVDTLAGTMVAVWNGEGTKLKRQFRAPSVFEDMHPRRAVENLLRLAEPQ